jgi:hypothetical protein
VTDADTDALTPPTSERNKRKRLYHRVLRVVRYQTGGPDVPNDQPAGARLPVILGSLCTEASVSDAQRAIRAAVENGDLLVYEGADGRRRYARTTDRGLRSLIAEQADRVPPRRDLIGRCNRLLHGGGE